MVLGSNLILFVEVIWTHSGGWGWIPFRSSDALNPSQFLHRVSRKHMKSSRMLSLLERPIILITWTITSNVIITSLLKSFPASNDAAVKTSHTICNASTEIICKKQMIVKLMTIYYNLFRKIYCISKLSLRQHLDCLQLFLLSNHRRQCLCPPIVCLYIPSLVLPHGCTNFDIAKSKKKAGIE